MVNASSVLVAQVSTMEWISARNKIRGVVTSRTDDDTASEIAIDIGGGKTITAVVTPEGADHVGAAIGREVLAIFKAPKRLPVHGTGRRGQHHGQTAPRLLGVSRAASARNCETLRSWRRNLDRRCPLPKSTWHRVTFAAGWESARSKVLGRLV